MRSEEVLGVKELAKWINKERACQAEDKINAQDRCTSSMCRDLGGDCGCRQSKQGRAGRFCRALSESY